MACAQKRAKFRLGACYASSHCGFRLAGFCVSSVALSKPPFTARADPAVSYYEGLIFGRTTLLKRANQRVFVDESGHNGSMVCPLIFGNAGATAANPIVSLP